MSDQIFIKNLKLSVRVGVLDWEQALAQSLVLNLTLFCSLKAAGVSDDLDQSIDYKSVSDRIVAFCQDKNFKLLETYAEKIAELLLVEFPVEKVKLELIKPYITATVGEVGVLIERARTDVQ